MQPEYEKSLKKYIKQRKKERRLAFLKAKKTSEKQAYSIYRPKKNNTYKKKITERKNNEI